jgi:SAM-dependent methyltransferase
MDIPMNKEQYASSWELESHTLEDNEIYEELVDLLPNGKVLEIGCGSGISTHYLAQKHDMLSLDNNQYLIDKAKQHLDSKNDKYQIHKCDLFNITKEDKKIIQDFQPDIVVAWFIGSAGEDVNINIQDKVGLAEKVKLYREKIEDIIVSENILMNSVKTIYFALRGMTPTSVSDEEMYNGQKKDYDTYVFQNTDFEVTNVKSIQWNIEKSSFRYSMTDNPNISKDAELVPTVIAIGAEKKNIKA